MFPLDIWLDEAMLRRLKDVAASKSALIESHVEKIIQQVSSQPRWNDLVGIKEFGRVVQPLSGELSALVERWKSEPTSVSE